MQKSGVHQKTVLHFFSSDTLYSILFFTLDIHIFQIYIIHQAWHQNCFYSLMFVRYNFRFLPMSPKKKVFLLTCSVEWGVWPTHLPRGSPSLSCPSTDQTHNICASLFKNRFLFGALAKTLGFTLSEFILKTKPNSSNQGIYDIWWQLFVDWKVKVTNWNWGKQRLLI